jgi:hypothetical protein
MVRTLLTLLIVVAAAAATGCSYPKAEHTYECIVNYERMTEEFDPVASLVYMPPGKKLSDYDVLFVDDITVGEYRIECPKEAPLYALRFRCTLKSQIAERKKFDLVTMDQKYGEGTRPNVLRLSGKVTVFDKGHGWMRFFLSQGATDFQVEARLTDEATGATVMEFVDRRRYLANTPFGPNIDTFDSDYVMRLTLKESAVCLANLISKAYNGLPKKTPEQT